MISNIDAMLDSVLADLANIQVANGYNLSVKTTSIVDDVVGLDAVPPTELPFAIIAEPKLARTFDPAARCLDVVTFTVYMRADARGAGTSEKRRVWSRMVADVEVALVGTDARVQRTFNGQVLALDTRLEAISAPGTAINNPMVILQQPVTVRMQPRTYGQPTSQG